ncbi:16S rRNA (cytosine(967)-C(5))-methyltransferase RsmB [Pullulanibacillus pueri]|uniref:16S rRNA (cytosine(967)-C(5))-methyltransferase RsmB n=1 Tax=Pullulanibacillus pueri TaxID=1437324 RepID=UPI00166541E9|nr:16S rRNA (cytosine(967)-C(5))-methyltransferase RsmB [Pullulanibacillus pueri]
MKTKSVRFIAVEVLEKIEKQGAYSQIALNHAIEKANLNGQDIGLLTQLVYGTIQRRLTLDFFIEAFVNKGKKVEPWVRQLLRLSFFQMAYLDKIPEHAIVSEAVTIAKIRGHKGIAGFVNGVLRQALRQGLPDIQAIQDPEARMALSTSHPKWLIKRWSQFYGQTVTEKICEVNNTAPSVSLRINRLKTTRDAMIQELTEDGLVVEKGELSEEALILNKGKIIDHQAYREGRVTIQDESSMLIAHALDPRPEHKVLDACAGPGGKTTHIAELMDNQGTIIGLDIHKHKTKLIDDSAARLDITNIHTEVLDARKVAEVYKNESFDRILVDAPCTGFGVIRRKPEIKYQKTQADIENIARIQHNILSAVAPLLKKGGKLVYSTCTIDKEENVMTAQAFLDAFPDFKVDDRLQERLPQAVSETSTWNGKGMVQILPQDFNTDGFFISCFIKG